MTHWTKGPHAANARGSKLATKPRKRVQASRCPKTAEEAECDDVPADGPLNGYDAGLLLKRYGVAAADAICDRVAREGGR